MRGKELIEALIEDLDEGGEDPWEADAIEHLDFPDEKDAPDSLQRWLAFDGDEIFDQPPEGPVLFDELLENEFGDLDTLKEQFGPDVFELLSEECILLNHRRGETNATFLYLGEFDRFGEYPVMMVETMLDHCYVEIIYPGIDCWIVEEARSAYGGGHDVWPTRSEFEAGIEFHAENNFEGHRRIDAMPDEEDFEDLEALAAFDDDEDDYDDYDEEFGFGGTEGDEFDEAFDDEY